MLLENDVGWKENMERRMRALEEALDYRADHRDKSRSPMTDNEASAGRTSGSAQGIRRAESASVPQAPETIGETTLNLSCGLGSFPGSSLANLISSRQGADFSDKPDLISYSLISLEAAEEFFVLYHQSLDPSVHHILRKDDCLANVRARSSLLTAAICTVGSFCAASMDYQKCYDAFIDEVSTRVFSRCNSFDDIRALCIGAFWLNKVSTTLVALAVRMAGDVNLHRCITKMPHTKIECYERTRLYFLLYVCDQHCSLIYGRPPITREYRSLRNPNAFLQSQFSTAEDIKLISQVDFWTISNRILEMFGADTGTSITRQRANALEDLAVAYETWRKKLADAAIDDSDDFFRRLMDLYAHTGKLYLFSHAFRGTSQRNTRSSTESHGMDKFERAALESALSIVRSVLCEQIRGRLEQLPCYFITMIAFASVALLKASSQDLAVHSLDKTEASKTLVELVEVLRACSVRVHSEHALFGFTKSLEIAIRRQCRTNLEQMNDSWDTAIITLDDTLFTFDGFEQDAFMPMSCLGDHDDFCPWPNSFGFDFSQPINP